MSEEVATAPTRGNRLTWLALKQPTKTPNKYTYPFLAPNNLQDLHFVRILLSELPYKAAYGTIQECWEKTASIVQQQCNDDGKLVFPHGAKSKALQNRFDLYNGRNVTMFDKQAQNKINVK